MSDSEARARQWIADCEDRQKLDAFAKNAEAKCQNELRDAALQKMWKLAGLNFSDPLDRDFHAMLAAYEHFLLEKHGRNLKAAYTRRALANKGVIGTLKDWAAAAKPTEGFKRLVDAKLSYFTGECVIVRHANRFPPETVESARQRLADFGVFDCEAK